MTPKNRILMSATGSIFALVGHLANLSVFTLAETYPVAFILLLPTLAVVVLGFFLITLAIQNKVELLKEKK